MNPFGDEQQPAQAPPGVNPFGDAPDQSQGANSFGDAPAPTAGQTSGPKGYLSDPEEDQRAYEAARERYERAAPSDLKAALLRGAGSASFNIDRPTNAIIGVLAGEGGFQFGKAKDRYFDDMVAEQAGPLGDLANVGGAMIGPGKFGMAGRMAYGALGSMFEGENLATEGEGGVREALVNGLIGGGTAGAADLIGRGTASKTFGQVVNSPIIRYGKYALGGFGPADLLMTPLEIPGARKAIGKGISAMGPGLGRLSARTDDPTSGGF